MNDLDRFEGPGVDVFDVEGRYEARGLGDGTLSKSTALERLTGREDDPTRPKLDGVVG